MVKLYVDSGHLSDIAVWGKSGEVAGITTNPSLMKAAGIASYEVFAKQVLEVSQGKPTSFEAFSDDWSEMEEQARRIASWGQNVWVKIPITNTRGESCLPLLSRLVSVKVNVTAVLTQEQVAEVGHALEEDDILSIFQGRIMDTGAAPLKPGRLRCNLLWASTRELYNLVQAEQLGFDIITMTPALLNKLSLRGKDLTQYSLETVQQFLNDSLEIAL